MVKHLDALVRKYLRLCSSIKTFSYLIAPNDVGIQGNFCRSLYGTDLWTNSIVAREQFEQKDTLKCSATY